MRKTLLVLFLLLAPGLFAQNADLRITTFNLSTELTQTGERFAVELRWRNDGPAPARFVVVTVTGSPVPFYLLSVATSGWPCLPTPDGTSFSCQNAQLDPGADGVLILQMLTPPVAGPFTVRADIRAAENDPTPANNSVQRTSELLAAPSADLSLSPTSQRHVTTPGAAVALPIDVANNSDRRVTNVFAYLSVPLTDDFPRFNVSGAGWTCGHLAYGEQAVICTRNSLDAGEHAPLTVTANARPIDGAFTITARVRGEGHSDPFTSNDMATLTIQAGEDDVEPPPPAPDWSRILLPLIGPDVPGANNALWRTEVMGMTDKAGIEFHPNPSGVSLPAGVPFDVYGNDVAGYLPNGIGQFLYVRTADESLMHSNARVFDVSRFEETAGSEIPIVRGNDFVSTPVSIVGIPVAPQYRHTLRVYDLDARNGAQVQLRIYANAETTPRVTTVRTLSVPAGATTTAGGLPTHPGVIQLELGQLTPLAGVQSVRVDIEPLTEGLRLWSFVSVTNNQTHHVTTFSQH